MKKITRKATELFVRNFTIECKDGQRRQCGSAIHTCDGTLPLWGQLVLAGLVKPIPGCGLGHTFSYEITPEGKNYLDSCIKTHENKP